MRSIARNLKYEDEAVRRNIESHEREMWGEGDTTPKAEQEEMDLMVAGDLTINHSAPSSPAKSSLGTLAKAGLVGAALAGSGAAGAYLASGKAVADSVPQVSIEADPYEFRLLPPVTEGNQ